MLCGEISLFSYRYVNGSEIIPNDRIFTNVSDDGLCTLIIYPALVSDAGFYECEATDDVGTLKTKSNVLVDSDNFGKFPL